MRWIEKKEEPPAPLAYFLRIQIPVGVNLDYHSFPATRELRLELIYEQYGLCAFTGVPLDDRMGDIEVLTKTGIKISSHIAHLKPQTVCRQELFDAGKEPGRDLGEDMDHRNMVAALLVDGSKEEKFGAAAAGDWWEPNNFVSPADRTCEEKFEYELLGSIKGIDAASLKTIEQLKLDHKTLKAWRLSAILAFINPENPDDFTKHHLIALVHAMDTISENKLPEYCFVIKNVAQRLLREMGH